MYRKRFILRSLWVVLVSINAHAYDSAFEDAVKKSISKVLPSALKVSLPDSGEGSFGSGFVVDAENGLIVTNYHVVASAKTAHVESASSSVRIPCRIVHFDAGRDLALLKADQKSALPKPLKLVSSKGVQVGSFVIAVGSPGGYDFSASLGIVSALNRELPDPNVKLRFIQVDAPMYHGSSGGPLANLDGDVVGVNSRGGANGVAAFAIPSDDVLKFLKDFDHRAEKKQTTFGYMGASYNR